MSAELDLHSVYIGNGTNDIPAFRKAGLSIAFNSKRRKVRNATDIVVNGNDLRLILPYMGTVVRKN